MPPVPDAPLQIAVAGATTCSEATARAAFAVGEGLARHGAVVLTGGRGGVMAAASAGAASAGALVVGILPGSDAAASPPNEAVRVAVFTGLGQARNQVLVLSAEALIAVGGGWGTLSEIALALKHGKPVVLLGSWDLQRPDGEAEPRLRCAETPEQAVEAAMEAARQARSDAGAKLDSEPGTDLAAGGEATPGGDAP